MTNSLPPLSCFIYESKGRAGESFLSEVNALILYIAKHSAELASILLLLQRDTHDIATIAAAFFLSPATAIRERVAGTTLSVAAAATAFFQSYTRLPC